jgi:hypothetical protein
MSNFDLLDTVLPAAGRYSVLGLGKYADQKFFDTREEVEAQAKKLVDNGFDVYFGCAKYGPLNKRTADNAIHFRALWMDIDCGPTKGVPDEKGIIKGYLTQQIGLDELKKFCIAAGMPRPIMVSSGYGVHAYWLIDETIERRDWLPLANRLRELCVEHGLIVDSSVFEAARVLRIPGTLNFKQAEPMEVTVLNENTQTLTYTQWKELLGAAEPIDDKPDFLPSISPMMEALMQNKVKRFKTIMMKAENGCAQLNYCFQNQDSIEEPLWRSALSIAAFCVDKDKAAHMMSSQYPGYNPAEVDKKVAELVASAGPHHCLTFEKINPTGCVGCPHKGRIKSPIVLGMEIAQAEVEDGEYVVEAEIPEVENETPAKEHYRIPEYPFPFFRAKGGGIWRKGVTDEDESVLVYEHDLYVVKRMTDPEAGEVALFRLHLPHDGVKEFSIPATSISAKDELRKQLSHHGVMATQKQHELLAIFVVASMKNLQYVRKAEVMRTQFGWVDNDSKFIVGDREITKDGVFYSPPSAVTRSFAEKLVTKGTFEKWKEVFNMYARPGLEPHAFAALTAFGSPLLKFTGLSGAIINVIHKTSGSGKSTALFMCNSVWGHPKDLSSMWKDTLNAKMMRLGVMNNLPNTIDEITNTTPMEFSDLAYSISQGRGKDRAKSQTNELRANHTKWNNMTLASSNASFYEKLGAAKNSPDGESMRLLEYKISPSTVISVEEGKQMFDHQMLENYGHAGDIYAQWLVNNLEEAVSLVRSIQARIDKEVQFTARERFWSAAAAINIAGGLIAKELGLHDYDMKAIYKWMIGMLAEMRDEVAPPASDPKVMLGEFMNAHVHNMLIVNGTVDARTKMESLPTSEPKGELLLRYEPDTGHLFIAAKAFKDYCVKLQIHYKDALKQLKDEGAFIDAINKRMSKGMKMVSPAVRALHFDAKKFENLVPLDTLTNEDRDGNLPS